MKACRFFPVAAATVDLQRVPDYAHQLFILSLGIPAFVLASVWAVRSLEQLPVRTLGLSTAGSRWVQVVLIGFGLGVIVCVLVGMLRSRPRSRRRRLM